MVQNLKTKPVEDIDAADLPDLTDKQMGFVMDIMAGKDASAAYRNNYAAKNMTARAVWTEASTLRANPKVTRWIGVLKRQHFAQGLYTKEAHLLELTAAVEDCKAAGNLGAMVNAIKAKGQVEGHYVALHEDLTKRNRSPAEMIQDVRAKLGDEVADSLARFMGVETMQRAASRVGKTMKAKRV